MSNLLSPTAAAPDQAVSPLHPAPSAVAENPPKKREWSKQIDVEFEVHTRDIFTTVASRRGEGRDFLIGADWCLTKIATVLGAAGRGDLRAFNLLLRYEKLLDQQLALADSWSEALEENFVGEVRLKKTRSPRAVKLSFFPIAALAAEDLVRVIRATDEACSMILPVTWVGRIDREKGNRARQHLRACLLTIFALPLEFNARASGPGPQLPQGEGVSRYLGDRG